MIKDLQEIHPCASSQGIIGCMYKNTEDIFILTANADNNFLYYGIAENSLLFVKPSKKVKKNTLMVFLTDDEPKYKLSLSNIENAQIIGKVIMCVNQYE